MRQNLFALIQKISRAKAICRYFFVLLSCLCFPFSAHAYIGKSCWACPWYPVLSFGGGYVSAKVAQAQNFPIEDPITDSYFNYSPNKNSQNAFIGDGFLGLEFHLGQSDRVLLQLGLGYAQATSLTVKGSLTQGADFGSQNTYSYEYNVSLRQLLVESKLLFPFSNVYYPYIFGGVGAAFNTASSFSTNVPPFLTLTRAYQSNTTSVFSYAVGLGMDFAIDSVFRIGLGYRFVNFGKIQLGSPNIDNVGVSGTISQSNTYTNEILAQVTCNLS